MCTEDTVELVLSLEDVDVNITNDTGWTALIARASWGDAKAVELLLADGRAEVNKVDNGGNTALIYAVNHGRSQCTKLLLADPRVDVSAVNNDGENALMSACTHIRDCMGKVGATTEEEAEEDPARGLVLLLQSRRCTNDDLTVAIQYVRQSLPTRREVARAEATGEPLQSFSRTARLVLPVLEAELAGQRRWCGGCLRLTPDQHLELCAGCNQIGYCHLPDDYVLKHMHWPRREALLAKTTCQRWHWEQGGHRAACAGMAAEAKAKKAEEAAAAAAAAKEGGRPNKKKKKKKGGKKGAGRR